MQQRGGLLLRNVRTLEDTMSNHDQILRTLHDAQSRDFAHYAKLAFYTAGTVVLVALAVRLIVAGM